MITKFKIYEDFNLTFKKGDIVISDHNISGNNKILVKQGKKYKVIDIYSVRGSLPCLIDIEDLETNQIIRHMSPKSFSLEVDFYANKYNL